MEKYEKRKKITEKNDKNYKSYYVIYENLKILTKPVFNNYLRSRFIGNSIKRLCYFLNAILKFF
jgi:hypothetical protein